MAVITLYSAPNFAGESLRLDNHVKRLSEFKAPWGNWNDSVRSVRFEAGHCKAWLLYTDNSCNGRALLVKKDLAELPAGFSGRISSACFFCGGFRAEDPTIYLFRDYDLCGPWQGLGEPMADLQKQHVGREKANDWASSAIVVRGTWELFEHVNYAGHRIELREDGGPDGDGVYRNLANLGLRNDSLSSLRPV